MQSINGLIEKHHATLDKAVEANRVRSFFAHWPEVPSGRVYGETANDDGQNAFKGRLNTSFEGLLQQGDSGTSGAEHSPYGFDLGITYPTFTVDTLVENGQKAAQQWRRLSATARAAVLVETLEKAAASFFEIAYATMHTTGQGFMMAFQASGPHAFDRALEAIAMGYKATTGFTDVVDWKKKVGKDQSVTVHKKFHVVPKGLGLVVGCSTFPLWNSTPGMFASLVTGNPVIVKPHPGAILPAAILVASMQQALAALELNPHIVQLAVDTEAQPLAVKLAEHPAISIIDYTGGSAFGNRLESIARSAGKVIFTEKSGVNPLILESVENLDAVLDNAAFSFCLYSGQMCTAPQNIFINKNGVREGDTIIAYNEVVQRLVDKVGKLATHPKIGPGTLGAIQNPATIARIGEATGNGIKVLRESAPIDQPGFPEARTATPLLLQADPQETSLYEEELFGPIIFVIPTDSFEHSLELAVQGIQNKGALSSLVYTRDEAQKALAEEKIVFDAGAPVSFDYAGFIWVNQSAAFSDFHGAGANASGNASFTDMSFVTNRYNVIGSRTVQ